MVGLYAADGLLRLHCLSGQYILLIKLGECLQLIRLLRVLHRVGLHVIQVDLLAVLTVLMAIRTVRVVMDGFFLLDYLLSQLDFGKRHRGRLD